MFATVYFDKNNPASPSLVHVSVPARYPLNGILWDEVENKIRTYCRRFTNNYISIQQEGDDSIKIKFLPDNRIRLTLVGIHSIARVAREAVVEAEKQIEVVRSAAAAAAAAGKA